MKRTHGENLCVYSYKALNSLVAEGLFVSTHD